MIVLLLSSQKRRMSISTALNDAKMTVYYHQSQNDYYGYHSWDIEGAVLNPWDVTVSPAQYGE